MEYVVSLFTLRPMQGIATQQCLPWVEKGADIDALDASGNSPLMRAAAKGHLSVVETLLAVGTSLNIRRSDNGAFAFHSAANARCGEIVSVLLKQGADKDALNNDGDTPWNSQPAEITCRWRRFCWLPVPI